MDVVNALGIQLRKPVPKGQAFTAWVQKPAGLTEYVDALWLGPFNFTWIGAAAAIGDLSHGEWEPSGKEIREEYRDYGGKYWDRIEYARHQQIRERLVGQPAVPLVRTDNQDKRVRRDVPSQPAGATMGGTSRLQGREG